MAEMGQMGIALEAKSTVAVAELAVDHRLHQTPGMVETVAFMAEAAEAAEQLHLDLILALVALVPMESLL